MLALFANLLQADLVFVTVEVDDIRMIVINVIENVAFLGIVHRDKVRAYARIMIETAVVVFAELNSNYLLNRSTAGTSISIKQIKNAGVIICTESVCMTADFIV